MKTSIALLFAIASTFLLVGGCSNNAATPAEPKSSGPQTQKYDPVTDTTAISKDGFNWYVKGNITNGSAIKATPTVPNSSSLQTESSLVAVDSKTNTAPVSPQKSEGVYAAGSVNFTGIEVAHFLSFYAAFSKAQLDTNQLGELRGRYIALKITNEVARSEIIRLFDKALYEQAGIVATHPDAEHVVFRFRSSGDGK